MKPILPVELRDGVNLRDGVEKKLKYRFVAKVQGLIALVLIPTSGNTFRRLGDGEECAWVVFFFLACVCTRAI